MTIVRQSNENDLHLANEITALVNKIYLYAERMMYKENETRIDVDVVTAYLKQNSLGLAFVDDKLAGAIKVKQMKDKPDVFNFGMFAVDYDFRGAGVGQKLVNFAESFAKENGAKAMQLEILKPVDFIDEDKERLKKWYTKIGYEFQEAILFQEVYPQHFHKFKIPVVFDVYLKKLA